MEELEDYLATHIGGGKFTVVLEDGKVVNAGPNMCGMIMYTYFEDSDLPEVGWQVTRTQLIKDYFPKIQGDILSGKFQDNILLGKIKLN